MSERKISHIRIYTQGQPIKGLPFQGELMTCYICGAQHRSNPKEESNWNCFEHRGVWVYLCPGCWSQENLEKVLRDLALFFRVEPEGEAQLNEWASEDLLAVARSKIWLRRGSETV